MLIDQETVSNKNLIINYIPMFILILEFESDHQSNIN